MAIARNASLVGASLLMLIGIIWSIAAVASPAWQVVNLREYQTEHEHGLWQDCARTVKTGTYQGTMYDNQGALHCTYKFDYSPGQLVDSNDLYVDENSAAGETRYHQFYAFHVVFLLLIGASVFAGIIAICVSCGAPRYHSCAIVFTILSFVCLVLTFGVVSSFFIIAHRVDNRFVKGIVGTYEAVIGRAYYFELVSCIFYLLAFICSLLTSYLFLQEGDADGRRRVIQRGAPLLDYPPNYVKSQGPPTTTSYPPGPGSFRGFESNV